MKSEYKCLEISINKDKVIKGKEKIKDEQVIEDLSYFFKVLGDETRVKILIILIDEELCVCDIASTLDMSQSAVSHQLRKLKSNGFLKKRRDGKNIYYSLDDDHVNNLILESLKHIKHIKRG